MLAEALACSCVADRYAARAPASSWQAARNACLFSCRRRTAFEQPVRGGEPLPQRGGLGTGLRDDAAGLLHRPPDAGGLQLARRRMQHMISDGCHAGEKAPVAHAVGRGGVRSCLNQAGRFAATGSRHGVQRGEQRAEPAVAAPASLSTPDGLPDPAGATGHG